MSDTAVIISIGIWAAFWGILGGVVGRERDKSFWDGFVISAIFGPFGVLWAYRLEGQGGPRRPCPKCAELILPQATVCPFCRSEITSGA